MPAILTVRDGTPGGDLSESWSIEFPEETITVRELIRERVYQEVRDHNVRRSALGRYQGLVQPGRAELALNQAEKFRPIDWNAQYSRAIEAFESSRVLILIDDLQADSLDQSFSIGPGTVVTFLRLTLLVGG